MAFRLAFVWPPVSKLPSEAATWPRPATGKGDSSGHTAVPDRPPGNGATRYRPDPERYPWQQRREPRAGAKVELSS
jgi:hypothetical protein